MPSKMSYVWSCLPAKKWLVQRVALATTLIPSVSLIRGSVMNWTTSSGWMGYSWPLQRSCQLQMPSRANAATYAKTKEMLALALQGTIQLSIPASQGVSRMLPLYLTAPGMDP